ncbi:branched-chain amino acid ABC transporter permease [Marinibaculum pumilum]|uniref:Branched-chain amino acid ABC transporter permease n=1 Tax=Marinibaculum pumilum TaxID=1766165 RepID=A0ABV7L245_9PROT
MTAAISILFDGLAYAMLLFIISVGLSVTMGLMGIVNLAHGAFAMAGGYATVTLMNDLGLPFVPALIGAFLVVALVSVPIERLAYAPLYRRPELDQVLVTIGLVFMTIAAITYFYGPSPPSIEVPAFLSGQVDLGLRTVPAYRLFIILLGLALIVALWLGLERTLVGARIRAAVDNRDMAQAVGIHVDRLFVTVFALGSGLAALGGGLAIEIVGVSPTFAIQYLVFFLIVVAVGGLGSLRGAFVAAVVLGILDTAGKYLWPAGGGFFIYAATVAILLLRPAGLFGREQVR